MALLYSGKDAGCARWLITEFTPALSPNIVMSSPSPVGMRVRGRQHKSSTSANTILPCWVHRISDLAHIKNAELCCDACAFTVYMLASECSNVIFHPGDGKPLILYSYITCAGGW